MRLWPMASSLAVAANQQVCSPTASLSCAQQLLLTLCKQGAWCLWHMPSAWQELHSQHFSAPAI